MNIKHFMLWVTPPFLISAAKSLLREQKHSPREYEYIPQGWSVEKSDLKIKGWNVRSVLDAYKKNWSNFIKIIHTPLPFGTSPEAQVFGEFDLVYHNTLMVFAYSLALTSRGKDRLKMLDWGGGIGHYYLLTKALIPGLEIDYSCKDVPILAEYGQELFPEAHFISNFSYLEQRFDFILASASIHYAEDWQSILSGFACCTEGHILLTRLPVTLSNSSYVFVQRPYQYGYETEYLGWAISRMSLLNYADQLGLRLLREFVTGECPSIKDAPSPCEYRAYLFSCNRGKQSE
jgi:putative methyltransferase (TIGR04325 family)